MSVSIIKFPDRTSNESEDLISKWSAVNHPILFRMQRRDFEMTVIQDPGNLLKVIVTLANVNNLSQILSVGDQVYLETPTGSKVLFVASILDVDKFSAFKDNFEGLSSPNGFCNFLNRKNYHIITHIFEGNHQNKYIHIGSSVHKTSASGIAEVGVSVFLKSKMGYQDDFKYDLINQVDENLSVRYNIGFSENWLGFSGSINPLSNTILRYATNSAKQVGDVYGQNMLEFVPFFQGLEPEHTRAKFLSDFEEPTFFNDFPFSLSFIYSDQIVGIEVKRNESRLDVNGNEVSSLESKLDPTQVPFTNRLTIDGIKSNYPSDVNSVLVWLESDGTEVEVFPIEDGYVDPDYFSGDDFPPIVDDPIDLDPEF